ncbi:MAG: protocatechuate 3,4-dioxygenase [Planctomycetota bacterium]|nr:protocatechuate 3,4-dioxygenase [Planctomycetota bacterium]
MSLPSLPSNRRRFLQTTSAAAALNLFVVPGLFAEELTKTPTQTEGPFYPDHLPLDTDNDLLIINEKITPGVGEITHLSGKVLDAMGDPVRGAVIEIWQCDAHGAYLHTKSGNAEKRDSNFQGFGRFLTNRAGEYYFRTIKPVPYPGRTPHIHVAVKIKGREKFTTQLYIQGHPGNDGDGVLKGVRDLKDRAALMADFQAIPDSKIGELAAKFNVVLGSTPEME